MASFYIFLNVILTMLFDHSCVMSIMTAIIIVISMIITDIIDNHNSSEITRNHHKSPEIVIDHKSPGSLKSETLRRWR